MNYRPRILAVIGVLFLLSIACSSSTASSRCIPATSQQLDLIRPGIENGLSLAPDGWAVKSTDFTNIYMVAAKITGSGMTDDAIGVWAVSGDPGQPGTALSVNAIANEFSMWVHGSTTDAQTSISSDGVQDVLSCSK